MLCCMSPANEEKKYCVANITNNKPDKDVKEKVIKRKQEQLLKMEDKSGDSFDVTFADFDEVMAKFKMK